MQLNPHPRPATLACIAVPSIPTLHLFRKDGSLKSLEEIEREVIEFHIEHNGGQLSQVARTLGIGRSTLYRKIVKIERQERLERQYIG
ncbi:hypothetical protein K8R03_01250 [Candidatus Kaiserbacteria bacterium]|nr:hypothetical protein [Candidatus Kaiserbacteria bacterium]